MCLTCAYHYSKCHPHFSFFCKFSLRLDRASGETSHVCDTSWRHGETSHVGARFSGRGETSSVHGESSWRDSTHQGEDEIFSSWRDFKGSWRDFKARLHTSGRGWDFQPMARLQKFMARFRTPGRGWEGRDYNVPAEKACLFRPSQLQVPSPASLCSPPIQRDHSVLK